MGDTNACCTDQTHTHTMPLMWARRRLYSHVCGCGGGRHPATADQPRRGTSWLRPSALLDPHLCPPPARAPRAVSSPPQTQR